MILTDFKYKPRNITQIKSDEFISLGFDPDKFCKTLLSAKFNGVSDLPEMKSKWDFSINPLDRYYAHLASFRFFEKEESHNNGLFVNLRFPCGVPNGNSRTLHRNPEEISTTAFPSSTEISGENLRGFHISAEVTGIFCNGPRLSFQFDEEGNYVPAVYVDNDNVREIYNSLRYTPSDDWNLDNIDEMFIPELSDIRSGVYYFWLDRLHFAIIYDMRKLGSYTTYSNRSHPVIRIIPAYDYDEHNSEEYNAKFIKEVKEDMSNPFENKHTVFRYTSGHIFMSYAHSSKENLFSITSTNSDCPVEISSTIDEVQKYCSPLELRAVEIFKILNEDVTRFAKQAIFPESARIIANALSPLVILASQLIRSSKSIQMEEI